MSDGAVAKAGITIAALAVLAKSASFIREAVIASVYGRGPEVDAFFLALAVPVFVLTVIAGSFQIALVPRLVAARRRGGLGEASALARAGLPPMLGVLAAVSVVSAAAAPVYLPWLAPALAPETVILTADMLWIMTVFALAGGVSLTAGAILNAERQFALPAIAPVLTPLAMTAMLVATRDTLGAASLAWGAVIGTAVEAAIVVWAARRIGYRWSDPAPAAARNALLTHWGPVLMATLVLAGAGLIDQMMAARLGAGSASALGYGAKLVLAGLHIVAMALGMAVLPAYAEMPRGALMARLRRHLAIVAGVSVPGVAVAWLIAEPVITVLYQRGAFTAEDTELVASVLSAYAVQLPAYAAVVVLVRAAAVIEGRSLLAVAAVASALLTVGFNAWFMAHWGVVGIALATAPAFALTAVVLYLGIARAVARTSA
jgi:putative peptidoglycan lipid II flippase